MAGARHTEPKIFPECHAEPLLGPNGEVLDGGADVSTASIASYYQDVIYLCALVQASSQNVPWSISFTVVFVLVSMHLLRTICRGFDRARDGR